MLYLSATLCIAKQNLSNGVNVVSRGSPSRIRIVLLISLGITTLPKSSILRTIPVAFIIYTKSPCFTDLTVSICKTRRFILYLCTLKNNPLLCSYLIRQINVFRLLRNHYFYYFVCPTTLQNIKNIFIGIFYHKFCLCFLQYSHSSNDKSESRGIHKIEL